MMNAAFAELGLDWRYQKLPVPPELFDETVRALPGSGFRGANVTIPHKVAAVGIADELSDTVRAVGAANTLTFADGRIAADNTDAGGFLAALGEPPADMRALVLGAGGAARAVVWALAEQGVDVAIWNRTAATARELAATFGVRSVERPEPADIVVNTTSVGLEHDDDLDALPLEGLDSARVVCDLVYRAGGTTPFAQWGTRAGARVVDGLEILVRQGALSFELWTGREAPLETMRRGARGEISENA